MCFSFIDAAVRWLWVLWLVGEWIELELPSASVDDELRSWLKEAPSFAAQIEAFVRRSFFWARFALVSSSVVSVSGGDLRWLRDAQGLGTWM